jgi:hypothetical protein
VELFNKKVDPLHHSLKLRCRFDMRLKPNIKSIRDIGDINVVESERGEYGIMEYPRALPRAKLYANWQTPTSDAATLNLLTNQDFEPLDTVLLANETPIPLPNSDSRADPGTVTITDYHPKAVRLEADAKTASVLLLNDRTGPDWRVRIDGVPAEILRCNYIMRGVYLNPGHHIVEFRFEPSLKALGLSMSAIALVIILAGFLISSGKTRGTSVVGDKSVS